MSGQDEFFSLKHMRLLRIAGWAKNIAWAALIVAFLLPVARFIQIQNIYQYQQFLNGSIPDFVERLRTDPAYAASVLVDTLQSFLNGFVYFLLLHGLSLGLNMIVETDVNYREARREGSAQ